MIKWLEKCSRKRLLKRASRVVRKVVLCSPDQVKKVGILWHEKDVKAFQYLQDYFRKKNAIVRFLCFSEAKTATDSNMITKKETNWLGFPVGGTVETFLSADFDLLINITTQPCFPLEVITALSGAAFKIGWDFNLTCFYDLSVDVSANPDSLYLAEQQLFYLQTFNKSANHGDINLK
jgi:hypothetical protein